MSSFRRPLQVQMADVYQIVRGKKQIIAEGSIITILASVQPPQVYVYDQVKAFLGGARIDRVILVTTGPDVILPVHDQHTGESPCFFLWQGRRYANWLPREGLAGVIPHRQYWAIQELEKEEIEEEAP